MTAPALNLFDLVRVLRERDVEFVVIGGFALFFHGVPRATKDVDIVPSPDPENLRRLCEALDSIDARPEIGDFRPEEMPVDWSAEGLIEGGGNWIVHTRLGRIDVMQWVPGIESYGQLRGGAIEQHIPQIDESILVAGYDDLVSMKEEAGREQDRLDLAALRMARGLEE